MSGKNGDCNCLWGKGYQDTLGNCFCGDNTGQLPFPMTLQDTQHKRPIVDPTLTKEPDISAVKCGKAPGGYKYLWDGSGCNLVVDYNYMPSTANAGGVLGSTGLAGISAKASTFFADHKGAIEIGAVAVLAFFFLGKGKRGTTKERDVITKTY